MKTEITAGSRRLTLEMPSPLELKRISGMKCVKTATLDCFERIYVAGAQAALEALEASKGANLERVFLEELGLSSEKHAKTAKVTQNRRIFSKKQPKTHQQTKIRRPTSTDTRRILADGTFEWDNKVYRAYDLAAVEKVAAQKQVRPNTLRLTVGMSTSGEIFLHNRGAFVTHANRVA